jgi:UDP-glucose 4-epimerase
MTVVVTGGTGFLGSWVTAALVAVGHDVRIFDRTPQPQNLEFVQSGLSGRVTLVTGDITDAYQVAQAVAGADAIVHLAGVMTVDCADHPEAAIAVNLTGSQHVFKAAARAGIDRVVYASSAAVYGPGRGIHPNPRSLYGVLKLAVEGVARVAHHDAGIRSLGLRPFIAYGAGESSGIAAGPSIAIRAAIGGEPAMLRFTGDVGFIAVTDVAAVTVAALARMADAATVLDLPGAYGNVSDFIAALQHQVPTAQTRATGAPLLLPRRLEGAPFPDWLADITVTSLDAGIGHALAHWRQTGTILEYAKAPGLGEQ